MNAHDTESWSIGRSLGLLAATFAIVLGTLLPFAAMAAAVPGQPIVLCSVEGPRTIQAGGPTEEHPDDGLAGAKCAACVVPLASPLPPAPVLEPAIAPALIPAATITAQLASPPPPARAPPRPHSTAPPHA